MSVRNIPADEQTTKHNKQLDHDEIWLSPDCGQGDCWRERTWCPDEVNACEECGRKPTRYIRGDRNQTTLPYTARLDAGDWWDKHKAHVDRLIASGGVTYPPSASDRFHPELWKAAHWRWFKQEYLNG